MKSPGPWTVSDADRCVTYLEKQPVTDGLGATAWACFGLRERLDTKSELLSADRRFVVLDYPVHLTATKQFTLIREPSPPVPCTKNCPDSEPGNKS